MNYLKKLTIVFFLAMTGVSFGQEQTMDLSGKWAFQLDLMDFRRNGSLDFRYQYPLQDSIILPGITDDYQKGMKSDYRHLDRLTREYEYMGPAWYQRYITIPAEWEGKRVILTMERCHWLSTVYIGTKEAGRQDYISVPHRYDLTDFMKPGETHNLMLCIDNRFQYPTHKWGHAHTEFTQINWNGILGEFKLEAVEPVSIDQIQLYPDIQNKSIRVVTKVLNYSGRQTSEGILVFNITGNNFSYEKRVPMEIKADSVQYLETTLVLGKRVKLWDEFNPELYQMNCVLETKQDSVSYQDHHSVAFGMREVKQGKNHILVNNRPVHLRGTVENAVFPTTGYVPVDDASWERVLTILKSYGMNHMRFHSWCPPAAAFRAADKLGVYLQVELPLWGADAEPNSARFDFFRREQKAILEAYGNHPSFLLYCNGNEISGDFLFIEELTAFGRKTDNRHLYSGATARKRVPSDQYYNSHVSGKGRITVYEGNPSTNRDVDKASDIDVPVIAHEAGQRAMYPDFKETGKYTGPVKPRNFEIYRELLEQNGMLDQAEDFFRASGALTVIEYKDVIETLLRSSTSGGFQLLSINDYPGQGYAFIGILDPFWDSKGLITPEQFREFCAPVVPLLRFDKRAYFQDEIFEAKAVLYNYGPPDLKKGTPRWTIYNGKGEIIQTGTLPKATFAERGVIDLGSFNYALNKTEVPAKLKVELSIGKDIKNNWDIWVYPRNPLFPETTEEVLFTTEWAPEAEKYLQAGKKVVYLPDPQQLKGRKSNFHNHFWNPVMFKWAPMTLGCLIHEYHPVFTDFITSNHTDWQWWDILTQAKVIELQDTPRELRPFIQVIDSQDNNQKLGIGFEARVGDGKLLLLAVDTRKNISTRPATLQLLKSIEKYVSGNDFNPDVSLDVDFIKSLVPSK